MPRTIALVAGASGSGKSRLARLAGWPVLRLDDFYRDATAPDMPRGADGNIDWDDIRAWDVAAATAALVELSKTGRVDVPVYSIADNARTGWHTVDAGDAKAIVAEGIFAVAMLEPCRTAGVPTLAIWLDRGRWVTWWRRLVRDIREHRKPLRVLWTRGHALRRAEPELRQTALAAGFTPMTMRRARQQLSGLGDPSFSWTVHRDTSLNKEKP